MVSFAMREMIFGVRSSPVPSAPAKMGRSFWPSPSVVMSAIPTVRLDAVQTPLTVNEPTLASEWLEASAGRASNR